MHGALLIWGVNEGDIYHAILKTLPQTNFTFKYYVLDLCHTLYYPSFIHHLGPCSNSLLFFDFHCDFYSVNKGHRLPFGKTFLQPQSLCNFFKLMYGILHVIHLMVLLILLFLLTFFVSMLPLQLV